MNRDEALNTAMNTVNGPRARDYGDATDGFDAIGKLWEPILGVRATPEQVALCMIQVKVSRLAVTQNHDESWVDLAGSASLGAAVSDPRKHPGRSSSTVFLANTHPVPATDSVSIVVDLPEELGDLGVVDDRVDGKRGRK